jgi:hypothetical protein
MPTPQKGLSPLARAQFGLNAKQIRRSVHEHNAKKDEVFQQLRATSLPEESAATLPPPSVEEKVKTDNPPPQ